MCRRAWKPWETPASDRRVPVRGGFSRGRARPVHGRGRAPPLHRWRLPPRMAGECGILDPGPALPLGAEPAPDSGISCRRDRRRRRQGNHGSAARGGRQAARPGGCRPGRAHASSCPPSSSPPPLPPVSWFGERTSEVLCGSRPSCSSGSIPTIRKRVKLSFRFAMCRLMMWSPYRSAASSPAMAARVGSPDSATRRAAPAVSSSASIRAESPSRNRLHWRMA